MVGRLLPVQTGNSRSAVSTRPHEQPGFRVLPPSQHHATWTAGSSGSRQAPPPPTASSSHHQHLLHMSSSGSISSLGSMGSRRLSMQAGAPCSEYRPLGSMCTSTLTEVISGVGSATKLRGHRPSAAWLAACTEATGPRLRSFQPNQLASVIQAFVDMNWQPGEDWLMDFDIACISHPRPFNAAAVTEVLSSMAALPGVSYRFPSFVATRLSRGAEAVKDYSYAQLSLVLRCLSHFQVQLDEPTLRVVGEQMGSKLACMSREEMCEVMREEMARPARPGADPIYQRA